MPKPSFHTQHHQIAYKLIWGPDKLIAQKDDLVQNMQSICSTKKNNLFENQLHYTLYFAHWVCMQVLHFSI